MNKVVLIIVVLIAGLLGGGYYLIGTNSDIRSVVERIGILNKPTPVPTPPPYYALFVIFDPSGSGKTSYSVPRISTGYIGAVIDSIRKRGSGDLWLTYIDKHGSNNDVLHFEIPFAPHVEEVPHRLSGERKGQFDKRLADYREDSLSKAKSLENFNGSFIERKHQFLSDCKTMIDAGYAPKKQGDDWSDVCGSLNAGLRSLETVKHDSTHFRSILLISDGVQDLPKGTVSTKLNAIPIDVSIITVNHSGSKYNLVAGRTIEVDNLDRGLNKILDSSNH